MKGDVNDKANDHTGVTPHLAQFLVCIASVLTWESCGMAIAASLHAGSYSGMG